MEELNLLKKGLKIDGRVCEVIKVKIKKYNKDTDISTVSITIIEGRNHIVKKLFATLNHKVVKLKRESYGFLTLENLKVGTYRSLTLKEVKRLYSYKKY